jgi:formylglycine-generating enzyme required for sulfatase activity
MGVTGKLGWRIYRPLPMEWVRIPASEFLMGSSEEELGLALEQCSTCLGYKFDDEMPHTVYLDAYEIGRYEVTNKQYAQCVRAGACDKLEDQRYDEPAYEDHPVVYVSWFDAQAYCEWHHGARLPTEAEWEKAASGGDGRFYPWGDEDPDCTRANYFAMDGACVGDTTSVGNYPYGPIFDGEMGMDMAGNAWEWVQDWYAEDYYNNSGSAENPQGPDNGDFRVKRGGSWKSESIFLRSASRLQQTPDSAESDIGFRCARSAISP